MTLVKIILSPQLDVFLFEYIKNKNISIVIFNRNKRRRKLLLCPL